MCSGKTRPSVLWDNLTALQPAMIKEAQTALFLRKLPRHISALINTRSFDNTLWMSQTPEEAASAAAAAAAAAGPWQHSTLRNARRSPSPYRRKTPGGDKSGDKSGRRSRPPPGQPRAAATMVCVSTTPASATRPTSARRAAPIRKTNRPAAGPHFVAAAGVIPACRPPLCCNTGISHSNVCFPHQKPNFFERFKKQPKLFSRFWRFYFNPAAFKLGAAHRSAPGGRERKHCPRLGPPQQ
jgi:hypothetical protein